MSGSNILFVLTGSIAAYKACAAVSRLAQHGHRVRAVMTASALRFVGATTLEGLTGEKVYADLFEAGAAMDHIHLARWADVMVICPATAHTLNRLAAGLADDLVGALFLAHDRKKPLLVSPAMNPMMWQHPATQTSVAKLEGWGLRFIAINSGRTACGEEGEGRLAEPEFIVAAVESALARPPRRLRVLITSGGTVSPIDEVRTLTNISTGKTGAGLASHFIRCGHDVTMLRARDSAAAPPLCSDETFFTFDELDRSLGQLLGSSHFDVIIHAAAVSDFRVADVISDGVRQPPGSVKLDSTQPLQLDLQPNPKLVDALRARSPNRDLSLVAFKLTRGSSAETARAEVAELFARSGASFIVHNDLSLRAELPDSFPANIYRPDLSLAAECPTRTALAVELESLLTAGSDSV